ncbi:hypothetical protein [Yersinia canariae]|uniref:hypothetical protein n=3 Tax=Yersinia canariae TaxID=2607663 RepID=UPI00119D0D94|nr:hypothetical protein [Yersinia canariae]
MSVINSQGRIPNIASSVLPKNPDSILPGDKVTYEIKELKNTISSMTKAKSIKMRVTSFLRNVLSKVANTNTLNVGQSCDLIGITINPKAAIKLKSKIEFDGTGKIKYFKQENITEKNYNIIINNRIKPLSETPQIADNKLRTPGEALITIAGLIRTSSEFLSNKEGLENLIASTWMDGTISRQSSYNTIELIRIKVGANPKLIQEIDNVIDTIEKCTYITKRNDNYYGRLFETEISKCIVDNPNDNMVKVRQLISSLIIDDFLNMPRLEQKSLCKNIADLMRKDPPLWRYNLLSSNKFMKNEEPDDFIEMMEFSGKYSVPLVLSIAVKYIVKANGMLEIKNSASKHYVDKIKSQRKLFESFASKENLRTKAYGLLLPHQKNISSINEPIIGHGIRPIDKYLRPTAGDDLTEYDAKALISERTIGIGMSGSSNILHFLFRKLQSQNVDFPMDDAKLATASWLSYSGGHSFNEAYSVFGYTSSGNVEPLSFNTLRNSCELSKNAIDNAYNKVIEASIKLRG